MQHALNGYFGEMFVGGVGNLDFFYCQDIWHFYLFIYLVYGYLKMCNVV
jgi:hypothetical protein